MSKSFLNYYPVFDVDSLFQNPLAYNGEAIEQLKRIADLLEIIENRTRPPMIFFAQSGGNPQCNCQARPRWTQITSKWWCPVHGVV